MGNESCKKCSWAVRNCEDHLAANYSGRFRLPKRSDNPFKMGYDPELNVSPKFEADED